MAALSMPPLRGRKNPAWNKATRRRCEQSLGEAACPKLGPLPPQTSVGTHDKACGVRAPVGEEKDTCAPTVDPEGRPFAAQGWPSTVRHRRARSPDQREVASWAHIGRQEATRTPQAEPEALCALWPLATADPASYRAAVNTSGCLHLKSQSLAHWRLNRKPTGRKSKASWRPWRLTCWLRLKKSQSQQAGPRLGNNGKR